MADDPATLVETAGEIMQEEISQAHETTAAVIEAASEHINAANARAEELARAAMETEVGRRVGALETREEEWSQERADLHQALTLLRSELAELRTAIAATATLSVAEVLSPQPALAVPSLSTPPMSKSPSEVLAEVLPEIQPVLPASVSEAVPPEAPILAPVTKRHRFL